MNVIGGVTVKLLTTGIDKITFTDPFIIERKGTENIYFLIQIS